MRRVGVDALVAVEEAQEPERDEDGEERQAGEERGPRRYAQPMRLCPFRRERLLLVLLACTAFAFAYGHGWPDISRLALTQSVAVEGSVRIDRWQGRTEDKALYGGHAYSDKAPGMSFAMVPAFELLRGAGAIDRSDVDEGVWNDRWSLHLLRLSVAGVAFLVSVLLVGRLAEGLRPGVGAPAAATFGLGTMAMPLAATTFGHLAAAALAFGAFLLASRRRPLVAGLAAGTAVLFEYQCALVALVVLAYAVACKRRWRTAGLFLAGLAPPALALAAYNRVAFGSIRHFSYSYEGPVFPEQQGGFFGIDVPSASALWKTLLGDRGLVTLSPVVLVAAAGLVLLWRRGLRAEALACAAVADAFVVVSAGYFDPYGGISPGPRYFAPALPFLAVGLAEGFARLPRLAAAAAAASILLTLYEAGLWGPNVDFSTVWWWLGLPRPAGLLLVLAPAAAAAALALRPLVTRPARAGYASSRTATT